MTRILSALVLGLFVTPLLADAPHKVAPGTPWTHSWPAGEDATSTFYYFIQTGSPCHVRILWNGGASNPPAITDYFLEGRFIRIVDRKTERKHLLDLVLGKDTPWKNTSDYKLDCPNSSRILVPAEGDGNLSAKQRVDLYNLLVVLAEPRDGYRIRKPGKP